MSLNAPTPIVQITVTAYDMGPLPDGRTRVDFQHDVIAFLDEQAARPSAVRQILTLVAASLPPDGVMTPPPALDPPLIEEPV